MVQIVVRGSVYERGKDYVARILGVDPKYGLAREFLPARKETSRSGRTWTRTVTVTAPGLYEASSTGRHGPEREYYLVEEAESGLAATRVSEKQAYELAARLSRSETTLPRR
jgi:hypothetical protein